MIHFFLGLLFCGPEGFGWDPTVELVRSPSGEDQYDYVVEDDDGTQTAYRTLGLIAESSETSNSGKGMRVWRAVELRDGVPHGDTVVLKDMWRHDELGQEGSNMRTIAESGRSRKAHDELRHGVLTVLHHGDVIIHVEGEEPHKDRLGTHLEDYKKQRGPTQQLKKVAQMFMTSWRRPTDPSEMSGRRTHYRMVVKEYCTPLRDVRWDCSKVYPALAEVCGGTFTSVPVVV